MERLKNKSRKVRMFVYERIRLTIPKSSKLYCYVKAKKQKNKVNFTLECFFDGIRIWNKYIFVLHYRFNITHSNLGGEITFQSHVAETVNNNGIFKSKMLQMKLVSYSMRSPSSRSYACCLHFVWTRTEIAYNYCQALLN